MPNSGGTDSILVEEVNNPTNVYSAHGFPSEVVPEELVPEEVITVAAVQITKGETTPAGKP